MTFARCAQARNRLPPQKDEQLLRPVPPPLVFEIDAPQLLDPEMREILELPEVPAWALPCQWLTDLSVLISAYRPNLILPFARIPGCLAQILQSHVGMRSMRWPLQLLAASQCQDFTCLSPLETHSMQ